jgi:hypothetical protein
LRLRREEAFDLVRRAVGSNGGAPIRASQARVAARDLLGRDSESLSERNFIRILQDAHDANIVDLRRRGDDYEVAPAAAAAPVTEQLAATEPLRPSTTPEQAPSGGSRLPAMGRGRGRGPIGARGGSVPPELLSIGVVETTRPAPEPVTEPSVPDLPLTGEDALGEPEEKPRSGRKRAASGGPRRASRKSAAAGEGGESAAAPKRARKTRTKSASE